MEKMFYFTFAFVSLFYAVSVADKVPVLLWSPSRPLGDLPAAYAGNSIDSDTFHQKYLSPLTSDPGHSLIAFIQDKLNLEDFTKHADVYNPFSDGGVFKNIKSFMDEHFSVDLPAVHSPLSVLDSLKKNFDGKIHEVTSPSELSKLSMKKDESHLILVMLPSPQTEDEEKAFAVNDNLIGQMIKEMEKQAVKYIAMYTAKRSKREVETESSQPGRHLLEADNASSNDTYLFVNHTNEIYFLSKDIELQFNDSKTSKTLMLPKAKGSYSYNVTELTNVTMLFMLQFPSVEAAKAGGNYSVLLAFNWTKLGYHWNMDSINVSVSNSSGNIVNNVMMDLREKYMFLPTKFSYHCSKFVLNPRRKNSTYAKMTISGFQMQLYDIQGDRFGPGWDCDGFFTTPILMGLFPVFMFVLILFYGMYMLAGLSTMDRFDDPKGKTITVNVQE